MGDKSPKSKDKNQKQKDTGKVNAAKKAQSDKDEKSINVGNLKKK